MYIRQLQLKNVKLLRDTKLSFLRDDGQPRMWTVLVGENGLCKTTVLQAIGLAAAGVKGAEKLSDASSLLDRRLQPGEMGNIDAHFGFRSFAAGAAWRRRRRCRTRTAL